MMLTPLMSMQSMKTNPLRQSGSVLVMALLITLLIGLIVTGVYKMQSASTKKNEISARESIAEAAISFCYAQATMQLGSVNADTYDVLSHPVNENAIPAILKQCSLQRITDTSQIEATQTNNCSINIQTNYFELTALAQFSDGVKFETRSIVTDNPCI